MARSSSASAFRPADDHGKLTAVRSRDEGRIAQLYDMYREGFIRFAIKNNVISEHTAIEIYQDSFMALYHNIKDGKLSTLSSSLRTYLFAIGRNKILNHLRDTGKHSHTEIDDAITDDTRLHEDAEWQRKQEITGEVVAAMEEPCSTVLSLYYWQRKSMHEIARTMKYKNEQVAKNRKLICLRKLKETLSEKLKMEELI